ncbi:MAG TPA: hypothetical protein DEQ14_03020 [Treponema sp.]|nr:hypothetical protein [Treponema sp.]
MTAIRKIVDSSELAKLFDLPPALRNGKVEVLLFPADENTPVEQKSISHFSSTQIEEWALTPEIQSFVGALKDSGLPENITINDIKAMRLAEKYAP